MKIGKMNKHTVMYEDNKVIINDAKATLSYIVHPVMQGKIILNKEGKELLREYLENAKRYDYIQFCNV